MRWTVLGPLLVMLAAAPVAIAPRQEGSRLLEPQEQQLWTGTAKIVHDWEATSPLHDDRGEAVTVLQLRLREVALVYLEHESRTTGVMVVLEDAGTDAAQSFMSDTRYKKGIECQELPRPVASHTEGAGPLDVEGVGGWIYYSLSEEDPLRQRYDGEYWIQGGFSAPIPVTQTLQLACGGSSNRTGEVVRKSSLSAGRAHGWMWETLKENADNGVVLPAEFYDSAQQGLPQSLTARLRAEPSVDWQVRRLVDEDMIGRYDKQSGQPSDIGGRHKFHVTWSIHQASEPAEAVLRPEAADEAEWMPRFEDDFRRYELEILSPAPEQVEAVRFRLVDVSSYPGIATNAGEHVGYQDCPYHDGGGERTDVDLRTSFSGQTLSRSYVRYDDCPIDSIPDLVFRDMENPDFDLDEPHQLGRNGIFKWSLSMTREGVDDTQFTVGVAVNDLAASGRLQAEVRVDGVWYAARAEGATATSDETALMLPLDRDHDGMQDDWEAKWGVDDPGADDDTHLGAGNRGDGLSNFEEYRGVYTIAGYRRTDPTQKTLFVYDSSGMYEPYLKRLVPLYDAQGVELVLLGDDHMREEIVNWTEVDDKHGDQYGVVVMDAMEQYLVLMLANAGLEWNSIAGIAADVSPPRHNANTVILDPSFSPGSKGFDESIDGPYLVGLLGHELGHQMNVPHHGNTDGTRTVGGTAAFVAVEGGQHSGDVFCFMTYHSADKFCHERALSACSDDEIVEYPWYLGRRAIFCSSSAGTGLNSNGAWAGAATKGACLSHLRVRSW